MAKKGRKDKARKQSTRAAPSSPASPEPSSPDQQERVPAGSSATTASTSSAARASAAPASTAPAQPEPNASEAPGNRAWSNAFIALFLAYQLIMPLRYYLGGRGYDERFSWRMFSTLRMQDCKVHVEETVGDEQRKVALDKALQIAWIGMLERYRRPVIDKLLAMRCDEPDVKAVRFERSCIDTNGSALPPTTIARDCTNGRLDVHEGAAGLAQEVAPGVAP